MFVVLGKILLDVAEWNSIVCAVENAMKYAVDNQSM